MIRVFLAVIGMFFLPFLLYAAYEYVKNRGEMKHGFLHNAPINWLTVAGTVFAVVTLGSLVSTEILKWEREQQRATTETSGEQTPGSRP